MKIKPNLYQAGYKAGVHSGAERMFSQMIDLTLMAVILSLYNNGFGAEDAMIVCDNIYDVVEHSEEKRKEVEEDIRTIEKEWNCHFRFAWKENEQAADVTSQSEMPLL